MLVKEDFSKIVLKMQNVYSVTIIVKLVLILVQNVVIVVMIIGHYQLVTAIVVIMIKEGNKKYVGNVTINVVHVRAHQLVVIPVVIIQEMIAIIVNVILTFLK